MTAHRASLSARIFRTGCFVFVAFLPAVLWGNPPQALPQDLSVRAWKKAQGLPDDSVTSVLQTRDGYLWVGTAAGLARFDGVRFVVMAPQTSKSNAPICVTALCEDSAGRLWIGTQDNGLLYYEKGLLRTTPGDVSLRSQTINSIAEDNSGNLWLGTPSGLTRLHGETLIRFRSKDGLPNDFVSSVHVARSGTVWITTRGGMCQFTNGLIEPYAFHTDSPGRNPESLGVYEDRYGRMWAYGDTYLVNLTDEKRLNHFGGGDATASTRIWSLCEGRDGELWIGTSGKLYRFADEKFVELTLRNGELASDVRAICEDRQANLWLGTHNKGLVRLQLRNIRSLDAGSGLPSRSAVCLAFNPQGHAWIGFDHDGLYEGAVGGFERVSGGAWANLQNLVSSICFGADSNLWVGTPGAGLYCVAKQRTMRFTTADGLADNEVLSLAADSEGAVWVGTSAGLQRIASGLVTSFGMAEGLPEQPTTAILPARNGGVWLGFNDGELFRANHGQFERVPQPSALAGKAIHALCEDSAGRLWLGADAGQVACVIGIRRFYWALAPTDQPIVGILSPEDGDLWLATDRAVYCLAQKDINACLAGQSTLWPQLIYRSDSVPDQAPAYGWPRAIKSPDGTLWFATDSGVVTLDLLGSMRDSAAPPVLIEEIYFNTNTWPQLALNRSAPATRNADVPIRLPSDLRSLDIQFTALDLAAPEKLRFRHRLDGSDPDWVVDDEATRKVHYGRLPYGIYTFRVQAGDAERRWFENSASFYFMVPTPLWRAPWALALYGVAALLLAAGAARLISVRRFRHRLAALAAQQAMERERMRIAQDMHDEIGSKLTKISFMSERAKRELQGQEPVAQKLDSIAGTSRDLLQTLDEIVWAVNPHNDTLEHLAAYLGQYATEYLQNTSVECELHIPRGLPHRPLSAETRHNLFLAFEESLNNALKHGRASHVCVDMQAEPSRFEIRIEDNGCGFDATALTANTNGNGNGAHSRHGGNGVPNMRQRLALVGGQCSIHSRLGHGTTVALSVPLGSAGAIKKNVNDA